MEKHFLQKQELLKNLGDDMEFKMIFSVIRYAQQLQEENDKLTVLNRHYYNKFYNGDIDKMVQDFKYLMDSN
ncbi:MAG: hypothetical protein K0Q87_106 [Neobacillus sp.]|nr:hypothetical protein [Neobacillus sp.]